MEFFLRTLPRYNPDDPIQLVIPDALQMGWSESPALFCAATETAREIADKFYKNKKKPPSDPN